MAIIAEFTVPPAALPFGDTLLEHPEMRLEVDRVVPTDESALPFFWVWGAEPELFIEQSEREPEIRETSLLERVDNGALFSAEWSPDPSLVDSLRKLDLAIIESEGTSERWLFQVRAARRNDLVEFKRTFSQQGISISLTRIYDLGDVMEENQRTMTRNQRETLITAYREGYYDSPRNITQRELGDQFDVSHRAISERLRRGTRNLIVTSLIASGEEPS